VRVTVFGASGKIGRLCVDRLLADGHEVIAFVRTPTKLPVVDDRLTLVAGQLTDPTAVTAAIQGSHAVISALGPSLKRGETGTPVTDGTQIIVEAMDASGVRRYVGLATPSVPDPRDEATVKARILPVLARAMFPNALRELVGMTRAITESDLDWTIARITNPTDGRPKGTVRAGFLGRDAVGWSMTRADIAGFLADQLTSDEYVHALPAISN
jgi:uncharacterized protein YbjT (DUF2867 family)